MKNANRIEKEIVYSISDSYFKNSNFFFQKQIEILVSSFLTKKQLTLH